MFSTHKTNSVTVACVVVLILGNRHFDLNLEHWLIAVVESGCQTRTMHDFA